MKKSLISQHFFSEVKMQINIEKKILDLQMKSFLKNKIKKKEMNEIHIIYTKSQHFFEVE